MEKKGKIEKLVFAGDLIENELERIRIKINKIIEVLNRTTLINYPINTQPQTEERKSVCDKHHREICRECMHNGTWIFEDTPEEKEGWEERFVKKAGITLTEQQRLFCKNYVITLNGSESYRKAYGLDKEQDSARSSASELLTKPNIIDYIDYLRSDIS